MNFSDFFNGIISFGEALAIIPATVLCFIPMRHQLRFSVKRVICYGAVLVFACTVYMAIALRYFSGIMENLPLLLCLVACFVFFCWTVHASKLQCLAVFSSVCTLYAIPSYAAIYISGLHVLRTSQENAAASGLFQTALILLISPLIGYVFWRYGHFLIDRLQNKWVWGIASAVNILFFAVLCIMAPQDESLLNVPELRRAYLTMFILVSAAYLLIIVFFNKNSIELIHGEDLRIKNIVYHTQQKQMDEVVAQMEEMRVLRHDFRHSFNVIRQLAADGDTEEIQRYLSSLDSQMPDPVAVIYCQSNIINAILNYNQEKADQNHIDLKYAVDIPELSEEQEDDLLWILGNLLENAQLGCLTIPEDERFIRLNIRTINEVNLYIVVTNSFDGHVNKRGRIYRTTRKGAGAGIGLSSVRTLAEKYNGMIHVYHKGRTFYVDLNLVIE